MYELMMQPTDQHGLEHKPTLRCYACNHPITSPRDGVATWPRSYDEFGAPLPADPNLVHSKCLNRHLDCQGDREFWERMPLTTFFNLLLGMPLCG